MVEKRDFVMFLKDIKVKDALKTEESDYNFRMYSKEKIQKNPSNLFYIKWVKKI